MRVPSADSEASAPAVHASEEGAGSPQVVQEPAWAAQPGTLPRRDRPFECTEPGCHRFAVLPGIPCELHMGAEHRDLAAILAGEW